MKMKRRDEIILTALEMFNESGLNNVGVREIARKMDISVGNLSYHFPKKEDIVVGILEGLRNRNTKTFEIFFSGAPTLGNYLLLMQNVFSNQYDFRGVATAPLEIKRIYEGLFDYKSVEKRRMDTHRKILQKLTEAGEMKLNDKGIEFLVSFISLFARFWIVEAFLTYADLGKAEVINHYLGTFSQQMAIFATPKGLESMEAFFEGKGLDN